MGYGSNAYQTSQQDSQKITNIMSEAPIGKSVEYNHRFITSGNNRISVTQRSKGWLTVVKLYAHKKNNPWEC